MTPICMVNYGFCTAVCTASPTCATFVPRTVAPPPPPPPAVTPAPPIVNAGPTDATAAAGGDLPRTCGDCTDFQQVGSPFWCRCCEVCPDQTRTCMVNFGFCTSVCTASPTCATFQQTTAAAITVPPTQSTNAAPTATPATTVPAGANNGGSPSMSPTAAPPITAPTPPTPALEKPTGYIVTFTTVKTAPPTWPATTTFPGGANVVPTPRPTPFTPEQPTRSWRAIVATLGGVPGGAPTAASTTFANGVVETPPLAGQEIDGDDEKRDAGGDVAKVLAAVFGILLFCIILAMALYAYEVRVGFKKAEAKHIDELHEKDVELQHELEKEHEAEARAQEALTKEHLAEQKLEVLEAMTGISADDAQLVAAASLAKKSKKAKKERFEDVELKSMESEEQQHSPRGRAPQPLIKNKPSTTSNDDSE